MQSNNQRVIYLATHEELLRESYYRRLWMATRSISIPRRDWLDEIANTLRDFDGTIFYRAGRPYEIPLVDDVFGNDPDMRWIGHYLKSKAGNLTPAITSRKLERLELFDLYFRIKHPDIARHFDI